MIRLFVALPLPDEVRARLGGLAGGLPGGRWVPPENLHVTLRFIGEVDGGVADDVHEALEGLRAPAFDLTLSGVGSFGTERKPHALWVGIERAAPLLHLRDKIESALVRAGLAPETRRFTPHITLARLRENPGGRLAAFVAAHAALRIGPVPCHRFVLYSSHLGRGGALYREEADYPLDGGAPDLPDAAGAAP